MTPTRAFRHDLDSHDPLEESSVHAAFAVHGKSPTVLLNLNELLLSLVLRAQPSNIACEQPKSFAGVGVSVLLLIDLDRASG